MLTNGSTCDATPAASGARETWRALVAGAFTIVVMLGAPAYAQNCAGFSDIAASSAFCPSVEWMKNRAITTGCGDGTAYCPDTVVSRLGMAAFMKRLGTALTPVQLRVDVPTGPIDLDGNPVICATADQAITGYPRRAYVDLAFSANAAADVGFAADLVYSTDSGATWTALNAVTNRVSIGSGQWGGLADLAFGDLAVNQNVRWGVRMSRGGIAGIGDLADGRCQLRVLIFNRDGATSPF